MDERTLDRARQIVRSQAQRYLSQPNISSVGLAERDGEPVIEFTVDSSAPEAMDATELPASFSDGVMELRTTVVERSFGASWMRVEARSPESPERVRRSRQQTIRPGLSVSHVQGTAGTIGAIVEDARDGQRYVLSNWHVIVGPGGKPGDEVVQPGPFDDDRLSQNRLGHVVRSHLGVAGDCAVCTVEGRDIDPSVFALDVSPARIGAARIGDRVVKSGRTTDVTHGIVTRIEVMAKIDYGGDAGRVAVAGFEIGASPDVPAPRGEISEGGDSGSLWLVDSAEDGDVVLGLHFAGETDPRPEAEHALACNIKSVLEKLEIRFGSSVPAAPPVPFDEAPYGKGNGAPAPAGDGYVSTLPLGVRAVVERLDAPPELRLGYDRNFLVDESVPLPVFGDAKDVLTVPGMGSELKYVHYSVVMNEKRRMAIMAAHNVDGERRKSVPRKGNPEPWRFDDRIDERFQLGNDIYVDAEWDRGHLVRREDVLWGTLKEARFANAESFHFTNACPQHANFNRDEWQYLEDWVLAWAKEDRYRLNVFTGPVFTSSDRHLRGARVPPAFWKVATLLTDEGLASAAFLMNQYELLEDRSGRKFLELVLYQVPLTTIEDLTGLRFAVKLKNADPLTALEALAEDAVVPTPTVHGPEDIILNAPALERFRVESRLETLDYHAVGRFDRRSAPRESRGMPAMRPDVVQPRTSGRVTI